MKCLVLETNDLLQTSIFYTPYSRGKNVGFHFSNGSGRTVNLICEHVGEQYIGFFGNVMTVNLDMVHGTDHQQVSFKDNAQLAAEQNMEYLVNGIEGK